MSSISDVPSVDSIYRSHHGWLKRWLLKGVNCSETAADLAHDTFVRVIQRDLEGIAVREPRAYLRHIAKGLMINHWRRRDIEHAYLQALAASPEPEAPSVEERTFILETLYEIDTALSRLPREVKQAFLLAQLGGLKYRDIAQRLGVSEVSVKRYVKRALVQCLTVLD